MLAKIKLNKWESIWAPSTNLKAKYKTKAEITKENKPKVKMVIGKAKNLRTGSTTFWNRVKTPAVIRRADDLSKEIWLINLLIKNNEIALAINKTNKTFLLLLIKDFFLRLFKINSFPSKMEYFLLINYYTRYYSFFIIQDNLFSFSIRDLIYLLNNHFINNCIFVLRGPQGNVSHVPSSGPL